MTTSYTRPSVPPTVTTTTGNPPSGATSLTPEQALYKHKLSLLPRYDCATPLTDLAKVHEDVSRLMAERVTIERDLSHAKAAMVNAEILAVLNVEGKNETERKANRAEALRTDTMYQDAAAQVRDYENDLARIDADLDSLKRTARRLEHVIDFHVAVLRFLAG